MKYLLLSLFAGVFSLYVHGVDNLRLPDVRSVGMGGNVATQSILFNPALIVDKEKKSMGPNLHRGLTKALIRTAKANDIDYSLEIMEGDTGTNAPTKAVGMLPES